jgi:hypothetical protein
LILICVAIVSTIYAGLTEADKTDGAKKWRPKHHDSEQTSIGGPQETRGENAGTYAEHQYERIRTNRAEP